MTKTQMIIELLLEKGFRELPSESKKYRKFTSSRSDRFFWVGKAGGLRYGRTSTDSYSRTEEVNRLFAKRAAKEGENKK